MRLYDTLDARARRAARRHRDRSACTSAARPSTSASTSATRVRSCSRCGSGAGFAHRVRRDARPQHHRRRRQGLRGGLEARDSRAASFRSARRLGSSRTRTTSGWDGPTSSLARPRRSPRSSRSSRRSIATELRVRRERRRVLQRRRLPRLRTALRREARGHDRPGGERPEARSARLRPLEVTEARTRTRPGSRPGAPGDRAGTSSAPRWPRSSSATSSRSTAGGATSGSRITRTSSRSRASLGHAFARIWMHNGMLELDAAKMSKSLGNVVTLRNVLDVWGREALLVFHLSGFWSKPVDFDDDGHAAGGGACRTLPRRVPRPARARAGWRLGAFHGGAGGRLQHTCRARGHARMARSRAAPAGARASSGSRRWPTRTRLRPDVVELAERRQDARAARDFDEADRLRAELEAAGWEVRDEAGGYRLVPLR